MKIQRAIMLVAAFALAMLTVSIQPTFACDKGKAAETTADAKAAGHEGCAKAATQTADGKGCAKAAQTAEGKGCCAKKGTAVAKNKAEAAPDVAKKVEEAPAIAAGATK